MKTLTCLLALVLVIMFIGKASSQTITLKLDGQGKPTIWLDKTRLYSQSVNNMLVKGKNGIAFKLSNQSAASPVIVIKGRDEQTGRPVKPMVISNLQNVFKTVNILATDENLNLSANGKNYNLNQPFTVYFGTAGNAAEATFIPVMSTVVATPPTFAAAAEPQAKLPGVYNPGSAVYDALKLSIPANVTIEDAKAILSIYFPDKVITTPNQIPDAVKDNPFLKQVFTDQYTSQLRVPLESVTQSADQVQSGLSLSSIGGLDVTSLADGLAKFLVKRVKEELNTAFFEKLKNAMDNEPDLNTLFPKTASVLGSIGTNGYNYTAYLQNLRAAFKNDVDALDENLPGIIPNHQSYFARNPGLQAAITGGSYLVGNLKKQVHPGDIIAGYPVNSLQVGGIDLLWPSTIQAIQLLSGSLRDTASSDSNYWVNIRYVRQLFNNKAAFKIYLGLIYQQAQNDYAGIPFTSAKDKTLLTVLNYAAASYDTNPAIFNSYKIYILQLAEKAETINKMIKAYQKPASDSLAAEKFKKYFDASVNLIKYSLQITTLPGIKTLVPEVAKLDTSYANYLGIIQAVSDLSIDVNRKNYSSVINQTILILNKLKIQSAINQEVFEADAKLAAALISLKQTPSDTAVIRAVNAAKLALGKAKSKSHLFRDLTQYGGFLATLATAKNSDQMEAAIEAFALPAGSSSVKRESNFNVALNAYTGLFYGHEKIQGISSHPYFNSFGLTAPIGVSVSWGQRQFFNPFSGGGHASYSLFFSLLDVGAVAAYRFKDDTTSQVPQIKLKNIFSPGLFLSLGIPKTPLSLNFGAQTGPSLRQINSNNATPSNDIANKLYWRYSVSLVVDIPLLNFYSKSQ